MNILLVSQEYPPETPWGGIGTQTRNKARGLARLGHQVHVLTRAAGDGPDLRTEVADGVVVHLMQPPGHEFPIYGRSAYLLGYSWHVLRHLDRLMNTVRFDVLDFAEFGSEGAAYQLDRTVWNWVPVVVHLHGSLAMFVDYTGWPAWASRYGRFGAFMEELTIREADGLMASSAGHADLISRRYGVHREAIDVVHCGVDAELFRPGAVDEAPARPTVLFVGNIIENKGVHTVLEAVIQLRSRFPDIVLRVVGKVPGGTDLMDRLRFRLRAAGAEVNVDFAGFVQADQLPDLYRQAHVFCSPADFEGGTANVYLEAMACGRPVIASTAGGGLEAVTDGQTGLLVPPNDVAATAAALDRILSDPLARQRMGRAARQRVDDYFALDHYVLRVQAVYEKTIARSQARPERHEDVRE
jgi:glycogen synthase